MTSIDRDLLARLWAQLDGPAAALFNVELAGPGGALPSVYAVGAFATATVAAATTAVAELLAVRSGRAQRAVRVERRHAAVAFRSERYLAGIGWKLPEAWDPLAGDYATNDGFVRLHTNYASHRAAVLRALGVAPTRQDVARAVAARSGEELELAVVAEGGCAARMRSAAEWASHPQGVALAGEPLCAVRLQPAAASVRRAPAAALGLAASSAPPLSGVRVLDLTRVIAGPVCTRVLAAYGAEVLRIDPPGFEEVPALLGDTTAGKRRAALDLREPTDRATFERLVRGAHVLVHGYRSAALEKLGLGASQRREWNPCLVDVSLNAYGATGPWSDRRGFDSLVQMSCGIAARGQEATAADRPVPLPSQALDHGTGYLLAAATCRALVRLLADGTASDVRLSLARTARQLMEFTDGGGLEAHELTMEDAERWCEQANSAFGRLRRVRCPGSIEGVAPAWTLPAGPLGIDPPVWS
jgi:hypothetical protein